MGAAAIAFLAGVLSTLSPCVLPLIPIVLAAAVSEHRWAPAALGLGLALSFVVVGLFVATIGFAIGLDTDLFRKVGAVLLIAMGAILAVPFFQSRFALAAGPVGSWAETRLSGFSTAGLAGQFLLGLFLGIVWSPCVGPTLGAASVMAARSENLGQVALIMLVFGIGAALPLILIGLLSREALARWRGRLRATGQGARVIMGVVLVVAGLLVATGYDKRVETALLDASPAWLTELTTRF
jgi:cytochrome c biogenesis protein CcdA